MKEFTKAVIWNYMHRFGKHYFIWRFFVLRITVPTALLTAALNQMHESTGDFQRDLLYFGVKALLGLVIGVPVSVLIARQWWREYERYFRG